jgi:cobalamin biosynthesis protein CobT
VWLEDRSQGRLDGTERTLTPDRPETRYDNLPLDSVLRVGVEAFDQGGTKIAAGVSDWLTIQPGENQADVSLIQTGASLDVHISFDDDDNSADDDNSTGDDDSADNDDDDDNGTDDDDNGTDDDDNGTDDDDNGTDDDNNGTDDDDNGTDDDNGSGGTGGGTGGGTTVTYTNTVKSIIDSRCVTCHQAGGMASGKPLTTYAEVSRYVSNGKLESALNGSMSSYAGSDKATLLAWVRSGAPQ